MPTNSSLGSTRDFCSEASPIRVRIFFNSISATTKQTMVSVLENFGIRDRQKEFIPAKITTLQIIHYEPGELSPPEWYKPGYSWYCTGYTTRKLSDSVYSISEKRSIEQNAMRHKIGRFDSKKYYAKGDTSNFDLNSDLEPEPEIIAPISNPINENLLHSKLRISITYRNI
ncbi:hypothetical protein C2G38_2184799 [Gigaspora rosea]|uniref:Uncharacterized protein n=1 Tax=Gigaspora rosea TaxID=44941 RepID=A0A397V735_9GLOM|nr:hypothetical protein C2G38_2184799 [Gigaspora rosea]